MSRVAAAGCVLELRTADALTTRAAKALVDAALTREALPDEAP